MITVRESVLELCRDHGLVTWFGNPGSSELTLLRDFPEDFRYLLGLQEMVPVGMADGFAQIARQPALVNLHTAPGLGNAMGAIYNAAWNKTPLIITAGNQRRTMQNQRCLLTNVDATLLPRPLVKWSAEPAVASEVPAVLAHAIHLALSPPQGPVFVSLPMDDMEANLDDTQAAAIATVRARTVAHGGRLTDADVKDIAARINAAHSVAIVVGGDVERAGAAAGITELAERMASAVWSAPLPGLSGFPESHPLYQGVLPAGAGWLSDALSGHDLVLVLGAPVFRYYPYVPGPYLPAGAELIHITNDPDEAARAPVGSAYVADPNATTQALLDHVETTTRARHPQREPAASSNTNAPVDPAALWAAIDRAAPDDALWVSEAGSNETPISQQVRARTAFSHLSAAGGGLGFGLPAALGAQLAAPERPVVALMGDGSMHYAITALWTAATYRIPVTVVVASNAEYGVLKQFAQLEQTPEIPGLELPGLDIVATAASYGVTAYEAASTDDVQDLLKAATTERNGPTLINIRTTRVFPT